MKVVLRDQQGRTSNGRPVTHTVLECPDCARLTILQTQQGSPSVVLRVFPSDDDMKMDVKHLPEDCLGLLQRRASSPGRGGP